jgi:hypothetical protein
MQGEAWEFSFSIYHFPFLIGHWFPGLFNGPETDEGWRWQMKNHK